ncbi:MAG: hypothetical protein G8345_05060 [Magnetococcales bacterium]|nr:hypothetical protein [Magnetococcales bacterium]NGZ26241.1 hypothetical protein [Magnetococcales bacterium]
MEFMEPSLENREESVQGSSDRGFGLVFSAFFAIIALWILVNEGVFSWPAWGAAGVFLLLGLVVPRVLSPFNRWWTRFGLLLHRLVSPLVMGILFFLVITPFAIFFRLLGKDLLNLKFPSNQTSCWVHRQPAGPEPETMKFQF